MYVHCVHVNVLYILHGNLGGNLHMNVVRTVIARSTSETANKQSRSLTASSATGDVGVLVNHVVCESSLRDRIGPR